MQSSYLFSNNLRIHYLRWNHAGDGQPVVLLHGLASNARIWELVAPYLEREGFAVYAPDLRGHGLTDKPDGDYGFPTFSRDLAAWLEACNLEQPILVGHSWGAMVALDYAARLHSGLRSPSRLVLVDGGMTQLDDAPEDSPPPTWEAVRERLAPPQLKGMLLPDFLERISQGADGWKPDEQAVPIILANFDVNEDESISPRLSSDHHMQIVRAMWDFKTFDYYPKVRVPVMMVPARPKAPFSRREEQFLAAKERGIYQAQQKLRDTQVNWLPDTVHDIPLQRPSELAGLIISFARQLTK